MAVFNPKSKANPSLRSILSLVACFRINHLQNKVGCYCLSIFEASLGAK
jgi:hypothetical protein